MRVAPQFERLSGTSVVKISLIRSNFEKRKMEEYGNFLSLTFV